MERLLESDDAPFLAGKQSISAVLAMQLWRFEPVEHMSFRDPDFECLRYGETKKLQHIEGTDKA
jgi:hypothetical protein